MQVESRNAKTIFGAVMSIDSPEACVRYLDQACGDDAALRNEVEELLVAIKAAGDFIEHPVLSDTCVTAAKPNSIGTCIGPYIIREQIGEGGFGVVYVAEQSEPLRRKVALKVIKPGMDSKDVIARFEAERQALALMDHPNVARVLDAGTTEAGHPFFVMELVRGVPVTDFCDRQKLTTNDRLKLFIDICRAVQHAHQKGIIHRDLKPNNVLVTLHDGRPVPKVIDFGVAKALSQKLTERTIYTSLGQMIGTPMYMSPEQAELSGLDVDTRSDVYSLGVLLYEILTGATPFDREHFKQAGIDELRRIIREDEPVKPSVRVSTQRNNLPSTISDQRIVDKRALSLALHGDLDCVVMKALEKDRERRYESPADLAADIARYLSHEPVEASPPSQLYRAKKYISRHRVRIATVGAVAISMLLGTAFSTWYAIEARDALRQSELSENLANDRLMLLEAEQQKLTSEQHRLREEKLRSERHFGLAREAVAKLMDEVASRRSAAV